MDSSAQTVPEKAPQSNAYSEQNRQMRERLFIVLTLIPRPEIVFLDELTTGLDAKARRNVWKTLEGLKEQGLTIF